MAVTIKCSRPGCKSEIMNHKWGKIHASPEWLFLKSGRQYCPDHWPDWAVKWREEKQRAKEAQAHAEAAGKQPDHLEEG